MDSNRGSYDINSVMVTEEFNNESFDNKSRETDVGFYIDDDIEVYIDRNKDKIVKSKNNIHTTNIDIDLEYGSSIKYKDTYKDSIQLNKDRKLKGILKKTDTTNLLEKNQFNVINNIAIILIIIICMPIILLDIIYGSTDKSCINIYPNKLNINMKIYLLVSGYSCLFEVIVRALVLILFIKEENKYIIFVYFVCNLIRIIYKIFHICWNIIGAIIFWGTLYNNDECSSNIYNYLFITLIIKLVGNLYQIIHKENSKRKDNESLLVNI